MDDPPILLCLGRLFLRKGFDLAIEALPRILQTYPGLRLVVAGDGPERQALERIAHSSGVAANVDFVGWVTPDEVPSRLAASTLVLVPSHCEGLPLVALQAAAAGRPVIASRAGGLPEIVRDGETGLLVDLEPAAIAAAAVALLNDRERLEQMGAAARRHVEANFDFDRCTEAYAALYRSLATR